MKSPSESIIAYHEFSKHRPGHYAPSPGYLDWDTQPDPFRTWGEAAPLLLPFLKKDPEARHEDLYRRDRQMVWDFHVESVGAFLELSLGLSAKKSLAHKGEADHQWFLRMNPSSGNLHPTECHLILPPLLERSRLGVVLKNQPSPLSMPDSTQQGLVAHYHPYFHSLEPRAETPPGFWGRVRGHFQTPGFFLGLSSILWRESWKYGERAMRYCQHDLGHALSALSFAGNLVGWKVVLLNAVADETAERLFGFDQVSWPEGESEILEALCFVCPATRSGIPRNLPMDLVSAMAQLPWKGRPSRLSQAHVSWPKAEAVEETLRKPITEEFSLKFDSPAIENLPVSHIPAANLIRQRRSAVAFDGTTTLSRPQFLSILGRTLPRHGMAPFDVEVGVPLVHLAIFVHQVTDLPQGLYLWLRKSEDLPDLRKAFDRVFLWRQILSETPLFLLKEGDFRNEAAQLSCHQLIAGKSAFSLGMVARFHSVIDRDPWRYRHLFWETGMIGQVLYLEAEAQGVRGTGIGCFFDDEMHRLLGLTNNQWQSLYHFTVGGATEDIRLLTKPAYDHLPADRL